MIKSLVGLLVLLVGHHALGFAGDEKNLIRHYYVLVPEERALRTQGTARESALDPLSIKVLVWNIKKAQLKSWQPEFKRYGHGKNLLLLQEAYQSPLFNQTLTSFAHHRWDLGVSFLYRIYANTATGVMIGADVNPTSIKLKHSVDFEPVVQTPKTTLFTTYPLGQSQRDLLVISVHGINLTSLATFKRHILQMKDHIVTHEGPVLWAGDFNTRTKKRTQYLMKIVQELGLRPVSFLNGERRMRFKFTNNYLDHAFVKGLKVKEAVVAPESVGSDHKPMMLELALSEIKF